MPGWLEHRHRGRGRVRPGRYGVGGDGLGSIRIPAAFCGLVGLKPSRERLPRDGIRSPVRTLDAVGPIARTADDCVRCGR